MAVHVLRPIGRLQLIEWLRHEAGFKVIAVVYAADKEKLGEAPVLFDFRKSGKVTVIIHKWQYLIDREPEKPGYYSWHGDSAVLYRAVLDDKEENFGHIAVMKFVEKHATGKHMTLRAALEATGFRNASEIQLSRVSYKRAPREKYNPEKDPNQPRLF